MLSSDIDELRLHQAKQVRLIGYLNGAPVTVEPYAVANHTPDGRLALQFFWGVRSYKKWVSEKPLEDFNDAVTIAKCYIVNNDSLVSYVDGNPMIIRLSGDS